MGRWERESTEGRCAGCASGSGTGKRPCVPEPTVPTFASGSSWKSNISSSSNRRLYEPQAGAPVPIPTVAVVVVATVAVLAGVPVAATAVALVAVAVAPVAGAMAPSDDSTRSLAAV